MAAMLFGGMTFFSFGFAPVLFKQLPVDKVRPLNVTNADNRLLANAVRMVIEDAVSKRISATQRGFLPGLAEHYMAHAVRGHLLRLRGGLPESGTRVPLQHTGTHPCAGSHTLCFTVFLRQQYAYTASQRRGLPECAE